MKRISTIASIATVLLAAPDGGIRPRGSSSDYPAHQTAGDVTVAAAWIAPDQVRKIFATDLNRGGYIAIEVGVYPEAGRQIDLQPGDFMLQIGANSETVRAASAQTVAAVLQKKNTPPLPTSGDVTVVPSATIGYESGGYDPATGRRTHGIYTGAGVGVGVGGGGAPQPPGPAATGRDRATMQQELEDKALPQGQKTAAVAGYLYFPKPSGKVKSTAAELTYYGAARQIRLRVPAPAKP